MNKSNKEYLFEIYMHEYENHRKEMQNRINLQNAMAQRGINITVLTATLLAGLFSFLMKGSDNQLHTVNLNIFFSISIPLIFIYGLLIHLTLATWIYQLNMIFRILRYWNWIAKNKIDSLIGNVTKTFLWDRYANPPWEIDLEKGLIKYFQPLFLYVLCLLSFVGLLLLLFFWKDPNEFELVKNLGILFCIIQLILFVILFVVHLKVQKETEDIKENIT